MTIYDLLKKDHDEVKGLLAELVSLEDSDDYRTVLIEQIASSLLPHSRAEESVFYNTIRAVDADSGKIMHGFKEHMEAEGVLRLLQAKDKTDLDWNSTAVKLKEVLEHHVKEEETEIFAKAKNLFSTEEAESIGEAFTELKTKFADKGGMANAYELVKNLLPPRLTNKMSRESTR